MLFHLKIAIRRAVQTKTAETAAMRPVKSFPGILNTSAGIVLSVSRCIAATPFIAGCAGKKIQSQEKYREWIKGTREGTAGHRDREKNRQKRRVKGGAPRVGLTAGC